MATRRVHIKATTGWTVYAVVVRLSDGKVFDWSDNTWKVLASATTPAVAMSSLLAIGGATQYAASINLATINSTTTPVDVKILALRQLGGSAAPATDTAIGEGTSFTLVAGGELTAAMVYTVDCTVDVTTTAGTSASVKVQLRDAAGALVDLDGVTATCAVDVQRDGVHTQFTLSTSDFGSPNANGWFEATKANPNFTTDVGYTAIATVIVGGVTYTGLCNFVVWP